MSILVISIFITTLLIAFFTTISQIFTHSGLVSDLQQYSNSNRNNNDNAFHLLSARSNEANAAPEPVATPTTTTRTNTSFLTYANSIYGFKINYPPNWNKEVKMHERDGISAVTFTAPSENESDKFNETITISASHSNNMTLDEFVSIFKMKLSHLFRDFNIIDSKKVNLNNNNNYLAQVLIYKPPQQPKSGSAIVDTYVQAKEMDIFVINNGKAYTIKFTGEASKFDTYLPIIQKMINSFQIMK